MVFFCKFYVATVSIILQLAVLYSTKYFICGAKNKKQKQKKYGNIFLVSFLQPAGLMSLLPAPMTSLRPCACLLQVWGSYSNYLIRIAVAIPSRALVNALLGLLHIRQLLHQKILFDITCITACLDQYITIYQKSLLSFIMQRTFK